MAITQVEYALLSGLRTAGLMPPRPRVLELGKNNWYGDVSIEQLSKDLYQFLDDAELRLSLLRRLDAAARSQEPHRLYDIAEIALQALLDHSQLTTVDLYAGYHCEAWDLNFPLPTAAEYDVILDSGTSTCVFQTSAVFRTAHDRCAVGGVMVHGVPFSGWINSAMFSVHPSTLWDVAAANRYDVLTMLYAELQPFRVVQWSSVAECEAMIREGVPANNACLYAVYRKRFASEFCIPHLHQHRHPEQRKAA